MRKGDDLSTWRLFARVVELGSFTKVAEESATEPSTISRRIQSLENDLGIQLLHRSSRVLSVTDTGMLAYRQMQEVLAHFDQFHENINSPDGELSGLIRFSAPVLESEYLLSDWILEFCQAHAKIRINFQVSDTLFDFFADRIDLALRVGMIRDEEVVAREIGHEDMVICASRTFLAQRDRPQSPADLDEDGVLCHPAVRNTHDHVDLKNGEEIASVRVNRRLSVNHEPTLYRMVLGGAGVGILPRWLVQRDIQAGALEEVLAGWQSVRFPVWLLRPPGKFTSPAVLALSDWLARKWRESSGELTGNVGTNGMPRP